ncbi:uncharacterized protein PHALS_11762 [Plasmopara halstedii]|uniref:Uncharacterized protein n=1 Tax=Plasmopara halstedii TaxID=4781 RepID=A0A0P1AKI2_PLAHL|nr:uncharacterized protein PHALS_11762 [Plasmopara halstedii]CEG41413.1 hypothetical protein PHALS_11762 [Plasmopara halstedii]|eukprot:XP_024577782.1 hypothetical protein PHALS_11762 [Plasmopara halstedii]
MALEPVFEGGGSSCRCSLHTDIGPFFCQSEPETKSYGYVEEGEGVFWLPSGFEANELWSSSGRKVQIVYEVSDSCKERQGSNLMLLVVSTNVSGFMSSRTV